MPDAVHHAPEVDASTAPLTEPAAEAGVAPVPPDAHQDAAADRPPSRIKIGSQRADAPIAQPVAKHSAPPAEGKPKPTLEEPQPGRLAAKVTSAIAREPGKVPVPNLRRELPPELEAELQAALGDARLDDLIGADRAAPPADELAAESRVLGRVVSVHKDNVFVDVGQPVQGVLPLRQFAEAPQIGTELEVVVNRYDGEEGLYELGLPGGAVEVGDWSQVAEGMVVEARVTGHNKGGLECEVANLRGFIPAGQVSIYRVEDLSTLVGEKWHCVITEAKPERRNLVLSRRAYLERQREESRQQLLAELAVGQVRHGTVRNIQPFGAFVDLGGVDGLVHVSELSWKRIMHPSEVLEVGQAVKVKIKKIDPETGKISLGMKELSESPWDDVTTKYPVKSTAHGKVAKIMDFGAFVELEPGVEGLVHISELDYKRVFRVSDVLTVGQEVDAQVLSVDRDARRISLSLKALKSRPELEKKPEPEVEEAPVATTPKRQRDDLKGGRGSTSGGERFGLKW